MISILALVGFRWKVREVHVRFCRWNEKAARRGGLVGAVRIQAYFERRRGLRLYPSLIFESIRRCSASSAEVGLGKFHHAVVSFPFFLIRRRDVSSHPRPHHTWTRLPRLSIFQTFMLIPDLTCLFGPTKKYFLIVACPGGTQVSSVSRGMLSSTRDFRRIVAISLQISGGNGQ